MNQYVAPTTECSNCPHTMWPVMWPALRDYPVYSY